MTSKFLKHTRPYKTIWLTRTSFLWLKLYGCQGETPVFARSPKLSPVGRGYYLDGWHSLPMRYSLGSQAGVVDTSHAVYFVHLANTNITAIFNQSYLSIPTLPNEQQHSHYKADARRMILSFHEINKSWPNMKTKIPWDVCSEIAKKFGCSHDTAYRVSQQLIRRSFLFLEVATERSRSLYLISCWVTWVPGLY